MEHLAKPDKPFSRQQMQLKVLGCMCISTDTHPSHMLPFSYLPKAQSYRVSLRLILPFCVKQLCKISLCPQKRSRPFLKSQKIMSLPENRGKRMPDKSYIYIGYVS